MEDGSSVIGQSVCIRAANSHALSVISNAPTPHLQFLKKVLFSDNHEHLVGQMNSMEVKRSWGKFSQQKQPHKVSFQLVFHCCTMRVCQILLLWTESMATRTPRPVACCWVEVFVGLWGALTFSHAPGVLASTHSLPVDLDDGVAADDSQR